MKTMEIIKLVVTILEVLASVALVVVILFQSGKESGLGALSGNSDSYMNKNGMGNKDQKLASATKWIGVAWILLTLALCLL